jgi:hypothetical protein
MTFSSASTSLCEVDDVAAIAAGTVGLRAGGGGRAACWRVAGAMAGASGALGATGAAVLAAAVAVGLVLGKTLRAIGRGLGSGTFGLVAASAVHVDNPEASKPKASAKLVARAVDRNALARADRVTALLRGESFNR